MPTPPRRPHRRARPPAKKSLPKRAAHRVLRAPMLAKIQAGVLGVLAGLVGLGIIPVVDVQPIQGIIASVLTVVGAFLVRP